MLGRKSNWHWGRNSKREIKFIEKRELEEEIHEELAQDEDDKIEEQREKEYQRYLDEHWVNQLIRKRG